MDTLDAFARRKLAALEAAGLRRALLPTERLDGVHVLRAGRQLISFSCNDYLGLAHDPRVLAAAHGALDQHGAGAGASRLITGEHPLLGALERRLAAFKGAEAACVFGSGYLTNAGVIATLTGANDLVLLDELVHSSLLSGAKLSGARTLTFRHNDAGHLDELLRAHRASGARCLVATDGVFSMDGDLAPVGDLLVASEAHDAWLLVDDAHGLGVVNGGRGAAHGHAVPLRMGTLSKALGSYGGYVCASAPVIDYLKTRARTLVYSTALPPASVAAALASLDIVEAEPERVAQLLILRPDMPRSLLGCMNELMTNLSMVTSDPASETRRRAGKLRADLQFARIDEILATGLHAFLTQFLDRVNEIGAHISREFLVPVT
jgi:8-amino-7-oxononanoate synthase